MPRRTLYLLPGLLCDARVWAPQANALIDRYDVRIPDFRAFNSLDAMALDVLRSAPDRFAVAGHSMGGRVAMQIVRRAPGRVERLALLDTGTHGPGADEPARRGALVRLADTTGMKALADAWLPGMVHPDRVRDTAFMAPLYAMVESMTPRIFRGQIAALLSRPDASPWLSAIGCPTLVGVGDHDTWSPPSQHEMIAAAIPGAQYRIFPDSGHMAPFEAPAAVTEALNEWLEDQPSNESQ